MLVASLERQDAVSCVLPVSEDTLPRREAGGIWLVIGSLEPSSMTVKQTWELPASFLTKILSATGQPCAFVHPY
jgi:hypothetical protein